MSAPVYGAVKATSQMSRARDEAKDAASAVLKTRGARKGLDASAVADALRLFDLNKAYGPAKGISRSERWHRAEALGLDPDPAVLTLIQATDADACVWDATSTSDLL
ncbi:DNA polymerase delta, subunit 4 [Thecamonas trahens ATCC 50062]|uniref:DNA polymerase delta, subunit 4 n=1 Tax=Thecamonas trahens ATCC 50062 TaxID=461836 RepID=A0A0L0DH90_THETB|nr:DNA polymerase delta, subunit 4 [Thecamonas trahens ATCC 50062]KNC51724.1 DNA polymerase delta, subunit 4 [Thecamonas trahens ATCC 50062]|eukprot:XP_013755853.1 DNA polymerase delta, subunit 4 [Thecamonas trahens ATCC 50062]